MDKYEQSVYDALEAYVNMKPDHDAGLCFWFECISWHGMRVYDKHAPVVDGYRLISAARKIYAIEKIFPKGLAHLCGKGGFQPRRATFARELMKYLANGKLRYIDDKWQTFTKRK